MKRYVLNRKPHKYYSTGVTLIELMVSMTLGIVIIAGLMSMYLASRETDKVRIEISDMDANATIALAALRKTIQHAGYESATAVTLQKAFHTKSDGSINNPVCRGGSKKLIVSGLGANSGLLNPPNELDGFTQDNAEGDVVTVIYRPDNPDTGNLFTGCATSKGASASDYPENYPYGTDSSTKIEDNAYLKACSTDTTATHNIGMTDPKEAKIYSAFFLRQEAGKPKELVCYGSRSRNAEPYVIAEYIDNIQFRYSIKEDNKISYKSADEIHDDASDDAQREQWWRSVSSVQVAILVGSENEEILENPSSRNYDLLGETITKAATDKRMYKVYSTTIYLHNVGMK